MSDERPRQAPCLFTARLLKRPDCSLVIVKRNKIKAFELTLCSGSMGTLQELSTMSRAVRPCAPFRSCDRRPGWGRSKLGMHAACPRSRPR